MAKSIHFFGHDIVYYYVMVWIILYMIICYFESISNIFKNDKNNENIGYNVLCMFLNILNSLDLVQIIPHDFIIIFILKHKNSSTSYTCSCSWAYIPFLSLFIFVPKDFNEHDIYLKKIKI